MPQLLRRYATPLVTGLFLVSLVSGVALFLHFGGGAFRGMHEWLSMVLIAPIALHLWRNWRAMTGYLRHAPMAIALGLSVLMAAAFFLPSGGEAGEGRGRGGPPQMQLATLVLGSPLAEVAPLLDTTPDALSARLVAAGFTVPGPDATLSAIAAASGRDAGALSQTLLSGG